MEACPLRAADLCLALPLLLLPAAAHCQGIDQYFPASGVRVVVLRADEGNLACRTGSGEEIHFVLDGSRNGTPVSSFHPFAALRDSAWGDTLYLGVTMRSPSSPFAVSQAVSISLELPRGMEWSADIEDGGILARDMSGPANLRTRHGTIHLEDLDGDMTLKTGSGTIYGRDLRGSLLASCDDGNIDVSGRFDRVRILAESGSISLRADKGSKVDIERGTEWYFRTDSGDITLGLPDDLCARIDAPASRAEDMDWGARSPGGPLAAMAARPGRECGVVRLVSRSGRIRLR